MMCHVVESTDNEATRIDTQQHRHTNLDIFDYKYIDNIKVGWRSYYIDLQLQQNVL